MMISRCSVFFFVPDDFTVFLNLRYSPALLSYIGPLRAANVPASRSLRFSILLWTSALPLLPFVSSAAFIVSNGFSFRAY
jgi:hypothetical protein